jgi:hypothetical protein
MRGNGANNTGLKPTTRAFDEAAAKLRKLTAERRQTPSEKLLREGRDER